MFKKFATGFVTGTLILASVIPAFADTTVDITGNGNNSDNFVSVVNKCKTKVTQSNTTTANINLDVNGNSGGNTANGNVGSGVDIDTGAVNNTVMVTVTGGDNTADLSGCCCNGNNDEPHVTIKNNGNNSINTALVRNKKKAKARQTSTATLKLKAKVKGESGDNEAKNNVGGEVTVTTDDVDNTVTVDVTGGVNELNP